MPAPFVWSARIRFADTDASQRIHYTAIFKHFETAEEEFLRSLGVGYGPPDQADLGFPRVHAECDMSAALVYDDAVQITVSVANIGRTSYTLAFQVLKQGIEAARGRIVIVCMNKATQRAEPLPPQFADALRSTLA